MVDTQPALLTNHLLHSNSQLEESDQIGVVEVEVEAEARAVEVTPTKVEAAVVPDEVQFLPQQLCCRFPVRSGR